MTIQNSYPKDWYNVTRIIYKRAKYTCEYCGKKDLGLNAHHVTPLSEGGLNTYSNLVCICDQCHAILHNIGHENMKLHLKYLDTLSFKYDSEFQNDQFDCALWSTFRKVLRIIAEYNGIVIEDRLIKDLLYIGKHELGCSICDQCCSIIELATILNCDTDDIELCFLYHMGLFFDDQSFHYIENSYRKNR